jgi:hypothetical protein
MGSGDGDTAFVLRLVSVIFIFVGELFALEYLVLLRQELIERGTLCVATIVVVASRDRFQIRHIWEMPVDSATVTSGDCGSTVAVAVRAVGIDVEHAVSRLPMPCHVFDLRYDRKATCVR